MGMYAFNDVPQCVTPSFSCVTEFCARQSGLSHTLALYMSGITSRFPSRTHSFSSIHLQQKHQGVRRSETTLVHATSYASRLMTAG